MSHTVYATFVNPADAERAAGALLDHGVRPRDLSLVRPGDDATTARATASNVPLPEGSVYGTDYPETEDQIKDAERGITTTTAGDAGAGAVKGTEVGLGIGALAALAILFVPGVGLVLGAGALAGALGALAATAGAGAAAGAVVGYLKDLGVDDTAASTYGAAVEGGGAFLAVAVPSGVVGEDEVNAVLHKYAASNVNRYAAL